jgi:hypothetical protein
VPVSPAGRQGVGVLGMILGILDTEIVEIDRLVRLDTAEGHHHVDEKSDAVSVARNDESRQIGIGGR